MASGERRELSTHTYRIRAIDGQGRLIQWRDAGKWLEMRSENSKNEFNSR
jgi:hypothetical protein